MITLRRFKALETALRQAGYGPSIDWSKTIAEPADAEAFASEAVYVICNSGFRNSIATPIFHKCMAALRAGGTASSVYGHEGKCAGIDYIWQNRTALFAAYRQDADKLAYLRTLPWIGPVTSYHLYKNLGGDHAKPDVHMERLARRDKTTTAKLCRRLARQSGYRIATIDTVLWRACAEGLLDSSKYETHGWEAAFQPEKFRRTRKLADE
ncbi:hypothetical protein QQS45_11960 [Alteriqipengyuania flavescens]|uniref:hypothetical protein n=1 Tax=Alteriqipengyuania flavescens TaxID=3053610 RepID=UPI0025B3F11A|nr:hypothetical protein [Alteriqipengyuania flavescens]WJY18324.1 hypothetical protein QQW98_11955 [Alteriqipengyuania flavescens]WJY24265.1 hypothetical protein QQS45_11960 [Alteriqipengyuania flavescens]